MLHLINTVAGKRQKNLLSILQDETNYLLCFSHNLAELLIKYPVFPGIETQEQSQKDRMIAFKALLPNANLFKSDILTTSLSLECEDCP